MHNNKIIPFLHYARFRFHLQVQTLMVLPPYKGALFRGVFGAALRRLVCMARNSDCQSCLLREKCLYLALFDPPPPPGYADAAKFRQAPRPYILNPPLTTHQAFHPGDTLDFELVLLGPAIEALPYFIQLFYDQGRRGLGRERGRFSLLEVNQFRNGKIQLVYEGPTRTLYAWEAELGPEVCPGAKHISTVTLEFLTPLRLKERGDLLTHLTFPILWERLRQRLTLLAAFYGNRDQEPDLSYLSAPAEAVSLKESRLSWHDWQRYSSRQRKLMKLGGLKGSITFSGELTPFLPYLRLGAQVNIGQGTTFGLGRYRLTETGGAVGPDRSSGGLDEYDTKPF